MAGYATSIIDLTNGSDLGIVCITSDATVRPKVFELDWGSDADGGNSAGYEVNRCTTLGVAGVTVVPEPLDLDTAASGAVGTAGPWATTQPVDTASTILLAIGLNQRNVYRWIASPGMEFIGPATTANGIFFRSVSAAASAFAIHATVMHVE